MAWTIFTRFALRSTGFPFEMLSALRLDAGRKALAASADGGSREVNAHAAQPLREIILQPLFLEAVFLSSPDMFANLQRGYLSHPISEARTSNSRRWERKLVSYLQRFCTKNETASFFGPKNYGSFAEKESENGEFRLSQPAEPGRQITRKEVYWAYWAGCALSDAISADPEMQRFLKPRLNPLCELTPTGLQFRLLGRRVTLDATALRLVRSCDGHQSVEALATTFERDLSDLLAQVRTFVRSRILLWELPLPYAAEQPVECLLSALSDLSADAAPVLRWRSALEELESRRTEFRDSGFDNRPRALVQTEEQFSRLTGQDPRRGSGQMYADRFLFYEECKGLIENLRFSRRTHTRMCRQLQPALEVSGYYGWLVWKAQQRRAARLLGTLLHNGKAVPFTEFLAAAKDSGPAEPEPDPDLDTLIRNAARAVDRAEGAAEICLMPADLGVPEGGYLAPQYGLADLMISARNFDAIEAGHYDLIMAGLHPHMLVWSWLSSEFGSRATWETDHARFLAALPVFSELADIRVARRNKAFYCFPGKQIEYLTRVDGDGCEVVSIGDLCVVENDGVLRLRRHSNGEWIWLYLALTDFTDYLPFSVFALPSLRKLQFPGGDCTPRIRLGDVVYQRRRWCVPGRDILRKFPEPLEASIARVQQLRTRLGLPEHAYAKGVEERKPVFVDFESPLLIELLLDRAGKWDSITFEEMLPDAEGLWFQQGGRQFCCELRTGVFFMPEKNDSDAP